MVSHLPPFARIKITLKWNVRRIFSQFLSVIEPHPRAVSHHRASWLLIDLVLLSPPSPLCRYRRDNERSKTSANYIPRTMPGWGGCRLNYDKCILNSKFLDFFFIPCCNFVTLISLLIFQVPGHVVSWKRGIERRNAGVNFAVYCLTYHRMKVKRRTNVQIVY